MKFFKLFFVFLFVSQLSAQKSQFELKANFSHVSIPFRLVDNLIIVKASINRTPVNLIFDTGVSQTILINIKSLDSLSFKSVKKKNFTGIGIDNPVIPGLVTTDNDLQLSGKIFNRKAKIFLITGVEFNFQEHLGIDINGFIGGELIKDYIVLVDYQNKKLHFYKHSFFSKIDLKKYQSFDLNIFDNKPYITADVKVEKKSKPQKLNFLIDAGNSDALWIFKSEKFRLPRHIKTLNDYFGLGFSGEIEGLRFKLKRFSFSQKLSLKNIYTALPDTLYFNNIIKRYPFDGIIGNEILRRFYVIFDYKHQKLYLKKNRRVYYNKFLFNDTGMYLIYDGKIPVKDENISNMTFKYSSDTNKPDIIFKNIKTYKYKKVDRIVIHYIRKNSPADRAGLIPGDVLLEINGESVYKYDLAELEDKFFYHKSKHLKFLIKRKGLILEFTVFNKKQL